MTPPPKGPDPVVSKNETTATPSSPLREALAIALVRHELGEPATATPAALEWADLVLDALSDAGLPVELLENARLIAEAPDLLVAARSVAEFLNERFHEKIADLIAAKDEEIKRLREALEPFAKCAPEVERFVIRTANTGGSPIMPMKCFRLADFRRARAAFNASSEERR